MRFEKKKERDLARRHHHKPCGFVEILLGSSARATCHHCQDAYCDREAGCEGWGGVGNDSWAPGFFPRSPELVHTRSTVACGCTTAQRFSNTLPRPCFQGLLPAALLPGTALGPYSWVLLWGLTSTARAPSSRQSSRQPRRVPPRRAARAACVAAGPSARGRCTWLRV